MFYEISRITKKNFQVKSLSTKTWKFKNNTTNDKHKTKSDNEVLLLVIHSDIILKETASRKEG